MTKVKKGNITKSIEDSLVGDYVTAGWSKLEEKENRKSERKNEKVENKEYEL